MTPLINEYNESITNLKKKEYVYLSWIGRYWNKSKMTELSETYNAIDVIDAAFHSLNDELEAVNINKTEPKVNSDKAKQGAHERLRGAIAVGADARLLQTFRLS